MIEALSLELSLEPLGLTNGLRTLSHYFAQVRLRRLQFDQRAMKPCLHHLLLKDDLLKVLAKAHSTLETLKRDKSLLRNKGEQTYLEKTKDCHLIELTEG